jgi:hypothetical protein
MASTVWFIGGPYAGNADRAWVAQNPTPGVVPTMTIYDEDGVELGAYLLNPDGRTASW